MAARSLPASDATVAVQPGQVSAQVGAPTDEAYRRAETIMSQIPPDLLARARRGDLVTPLVYGLLLSEQPQVREKQVAVLGDDRRGQVYRAGQDSRPRDVFAACNHRTGKHIACCRHPVIRVEAGSSARKAR